MKFLINKNQYGLSAIVGDKEKKQKVYIPVWMDEEHEAELKDGYTYLIEETNANLAPFEKKDKTLGVKLFIREFVLKKEYAPFESKKVEVKQTEPKADIPEPLAKFEPIDDDRLPF